MRKPRWCASSARRPRSSAARPLSSIDSSATFEQTQRRLVPSSDIRSNLRRARSMLRVRCGSGIASKSRSGCSAMMARPRSSAIWRTSRGLPLKKVRSFSKISTARKPARAAAASLVSNVPPMETVAIDHLIIESLQMREPGPRGPLLRVPTAGPKVGAARSRPPFAADRRCSGQDVSFARAAARRLFLCRQPRPAHRTGISTYGRTGGNGISLRGRGTEGAA